MINLWIILSLVMAAALFLVTVTAADGVWTFIKLAFLNTALWFVVFGLTLMLIGQFHTVGLVISCVIYAASLYGMYKIAKAFAAFGRARRNPADYIIFDKICGECGGALMPDPFAFVDADPEKSPYEHIYRPTSPHELKAVDGVPELLSELDVSHRLADH